MSPIYRILFPISSFSNLIPIIPFLSLYKKINKQYRFFIFILITGAMNDILGVIKFFTSIHFNYMLINDFHEIVTFCLMLRFFYLINQHKHAYRYYIIFTIGIVIQLIDWFYISKFKYNTIYVDLFYYLVYCYLCLDRINFHLLNNKNISRTIDWVLIFYSALFIVESYGVFTLSLYCLNIPLNIKVDLFLYNILLIVNTVVNIVLAIVFIQLSKKENRHLAN